jgi:hypothetical protein
LVRETRAGVTREIKPNPATNRPILREKPVRSILFPFCLPLFIFRAAAQAPVTLSRGRRRARRARVRAVADDDRDDTAAIQQALDQQPQWKPHHLSAARSLVRAATR